jgi:hypothetical protein
MIDWTKPVRAIWKRRGITQWPNCGTLGRRLWMDKEDAEKMVSRLLACHFAMFRPDSDGDAAASYGEARRKVVSALTHTPVQNRSLLGSK